MSDWKINLVCFAIKPKPRTFTSFFKNQDSLNCPGNHSQRVGLKLNTSKVILVKFKKMGKTTSKRCFFPIESFRMNCNLVDMINVVAIVFFSIQCLMIIVSFISSLIFINKKKSSGLRFFILYTTVSLLVMVPMVLMVFSRNKLIHLDISFSFADSINNYSLLFNYLFLSGFIIYSTPWSKVNRIFWILFFIFFILILISLFSSMSSLPSYNAFAINHFALIIFSVFFLIKLFFNLPETSVIEYPLFWIVIGVLSCSVINFPLFYLLDLLTKLNENNVDTWWLTNIRPLGYSIMYFMFSIAFKISSK